MTFVILGLLIIFAISNAIAKRANLKPVVVITSSAAWVLMFETMLRLIAPQVPYFTVSVAIAAPIIFIICLNTLYSPEQREGFFKNSFMKDKWVRLMIAIPIIMACLSCEALVIIWGVTR